MNVKSHHSAELPIKIPPCLSTRVLYMKISTSEWNIYAILTTLWHLTRQQQGAKKNNDFKKTLPSVFWRKNTSNKQTLCRNFSHYMGFCCKKEYLIFLIQWNVHQFTKTIKPFFTEGNVSKHLFSIVSLLHPVNDWQLITTSS